MEEASVSRSGNGYIRWFEDFSAGDIGAVGGKNASLGEMIATLGEAGIRVPRGFAITTDAYWRLLEHNRMEAELELSYPTIRNRLHDVIRALGYEPGKEEPAEVAEDKREQVLEDLEAGKITADDAMRILKGVSS